MRNILIDRIKAFVGRSPQDVAFEKKKREFEETLQKKVQAVKEFRESEAWKLIEEFLNTKIDHLKNKLETCKEDELIQLQAEITSTKNLLFALKTWVSTVELEGLK